MKKNNLRLLILFIMPAMILFVGMASNPLGKWYTYKSEKTKVKKLIFPESFTEKKLEGNEEFETYEISAVTGDKDQYVLFVAIYKDPVNDPYETAKTSLKNFAESIGGRIYYERDFNYGKDEKGRIATIRKEQLEIKYRTILIGKYHYQLITAFPKGILGFDQRDASAKFFKSFKVVE
jgi:hypothetical protein